MKATGIVRRIDDLGRIVIPKEIRRTLRIREADPLEIFTDREGEIILKKYSAIGEMTTFARQYAESLAQVSGHTVLIADRDQFIAAAGGCRNLIGKPLSREMEQHREMLDKGGAIGRKLDFLIQEFNREANTIGSKCSDIDIARQVVDIKAEIEKIREQVQNIE